MINLAIVSPRQTATTETFIDAHRTVSGTKVFFYYNGIEKAKLEGYGQLLDLSLGIACAKKLGIRWQNIISPLHRKQ